MLLAFGTGPEFRSALPTIRPIVRIYETIKGPGPTVFKSPEEADRWVTQLIQSVNRAITFGHSLISLALALAGGTVCWLVAIWRKNQARRSENPPAVEGPPRLDSPGGEPEPKAVTRCRL